MTENSLSVVFLHQNPEYIVPCAALLNKQWSRSSSARFQSLEKSFKDLPDSVLLLEEKSGEKNVIGHSRLSRVLEDSSGCWIGSVVISEEKRNKGFGKYLMKKTEEYAKKLNFSTAYLNTHDKQGFYEHLGYKYCEPVSSTNFKLQGLRMNGIFKSNKNELSNIYLGNEQYDWSKSGQNIGIVCCEDEQIINTNIPPPPPPLPQKQPLHTPTLKNNLGKYWMKKPL